MIDSIVREKKEIWIVVRNENQIHVKTDDKDAKWRKMCCERWRIEQKWWKWVGLIIGQAN
jgi:hypothetical protein